MSNFPEDVKYSMDHVWVRDGNGDYLRIGVTDYVANESGPIVAVRLPQAGSDVVAGDPCGELETDSDTFEVICPAPGLISRVNTIVSQTPQLVSTDPYGDGWLFDLETDDDTDDELLDAEEYLDQALPEGVSKD